MNVETLINELGLTVVASNNNLAREVDGAYTSDLLSWVMSNARPGNVWITVQTNINIVAIATFVEVSCIIIPENIKVDDFICSKASEKDVIILSSSDSAYQICKKLGTILGE